MKHVAALSLCLAAGLCAQQVPQFKNVLEKAHLPDRNFAFNETHEVVLADFDGDGDLDCYVLNTYPHPMAGADDELLLNDGAGRFTHAPVAPPLTEFQAGGAAAGDLDGDGDIDVFGPGLVLFNDGSGAFTPSTTSADSAGYSIHKVDLADMDGDGDLDAVIVRWYGPILIVYNDGAGNFPRSASTQFGDGSTAADVGDLDGDGDLDVIANRAWLNQGNGNFSSGPALFDLALRVQAGDVDGDGDLDLLVGKAKNDTCLLLNDGSANFTDVTSTHLPPFDGQRLVLGDLDGDNDLDIVDNGSVLRNDGTGVFTKSQAPGYASVHALGDVDGDGDLDVMNGNHGNWYGFILGVQNTLWINDGAANFANGVVDRADWGVRLGSLTAVDLDLDGDEDIAAATGMFSQTLANNGGRFGSGISYRGQRDHRWFGDLDGDGDIDTLTTGPTWGPVTAYLHQPGAFAMRIDAFPGPSSIVDGALVDFDGDSDLDFVGTGPQYTLYLRSNGDGSFRDRTANVLPANTPPANAVATGDYDADGLVDIALATTGANRLYRNLGNGTFADISGLLPPATANSTAIHFFDFDDNGRDDLVVGHADGSIQLVASYAFGLIDLSTSADQTSIAIKKFEVGDIDDDGRPDVIALHDDQRVTTLINEFGTFLRTPSVTRIDFPVDDFDLTDVDGDGDLDLAYVYYGAVHIAINHHRQLSSPYVPSLGGRYDLHLTAAPGYGQQPALVTLFLGFATLPQPIVTPFGRFALDPSQTSALAPMLMPASGQLELAFTVPNAPALNGLAAHWQALFAHPMAFGAPRLALSAMVSDRLIGN